MYVLLSKFFKVDKMLSIFVQAKDRFIKDEGGCCPFCIDIYSLSATVNYEFITVA